MTDPELADSDIGPYLRELRGDRSLREVYRASGVSDPFLSQIEKGQRRPGPRILRKLAAYYEVSLNDLLRRAGYLEEEEVEDPDADEEANIERAFNYVLADPRFNFGTRLEGPLTTDVKRFMVKMYEELTDKRLLE